MRKVEGPRALAGAAGREAAIAGHMARARAIAEAAATKVDGPDIEPEEFIQLSWLALVECSHEPMDGGCFAALSSLRIERALARAVEGAAQEGHFRERHIRREERERESGEHVRRLVRELPPKERAVIEGHYFQGRQLQHIAREMARTKGRISQIHHQALLRLRENFSGEKESA